MEGRLRFDQFLTDVFNTAVFGPLRETMQDSRSLSGKPPQGPTRTGGGAGPAGQRR